VSALEMHALLDRRWVQADIPSFRSLLGELVCIKGRRPFVASSALCLRSSGSSRRSDATASPAVMTQSHIAICPHENALVSRFVFPSTTWASCDRIDTKLLFDRSSM
jgi:hypothetical protein